MRTSTKVKIIAASLIGASLIGASPAMAESYFTSYMAGVGAGFSSRTWYDGNTDLVNTSVKLSGCSMSNAAANFYYTDIKLIRENGMATPILVSTVRNLCDTSSYGIQPPGFYHFTIKNVNGSTATTALMNATYVKVTF